jgi:hypothetical protein
MVTEVAAAAFRLHGIAGAADADGGVLGRLQSSHKSSGMLDSAWSAWRNAWHDDGSRMNVRRQAYEERLKSQAEALVSMDFKFGTVGDALLSSASVELAELEEQLYQLRLTLIRQAGAR